jgi:hypothetical protein
VRRKATPASAAAGEIVTLTGCPLWTPTPENRIGVLIVCCKGDVNVGFLSSYDTRQS